MRLARILGLGVAVVFGFSFVNAADDEDKEVKEAILKLAAAVEKNDEAAAKKLVNEIKKHELEHVMNLMKPPGKGGLPVVKEGIEIKLNALSKKAADVKTNAEAYEKL